MHADPLRSHALGLYCEDTLLSLKRALYEVGAQPAVSAPLTAVVLEGLDHFLELLGVGSIPRVPWSADG